MMKDLGRRLATSSISIAVTICLLIFAHQIPYIVFGFIALLTAVGIWEYGQIARAKGCITILPVLIPISVPIVLSFYPFPISGLPPIVFFLGFFLLYALHFRQKEGAVVDIAVSSFGLLYLAIPCGMLFGLLYFPQVDGRWWVAYLLAVSKMTDIGAYFGGNLWGKRKLAPTISPSKTVEGAVVGLLSALITSYIFHFFLPLRVGESILLGLVLGIVAEFGDLSESLLKRDANKKDSNALPGLGGILDTVDSFLFNVPILYFYLQYIR